MSKKYYVYEHREADTGRVFYIGKGFGNRSTRKCDRNDYWRKVEKKHGFTAHLIFEGLSESEALRLEVELIAAYGRDNLCNLTDGGEGVSNPSEKARRGQALGQASKNVYTFYHDEHGKFVGTTYDLRTKHNLSKVDGANLRYMALSGRYLSVKGWRMTVDIIGPRSVYRPPPRDNNFYILYNEYVGVFIGDRRVASEATGLHGPQVSNLVNKKSSKIKGWRNG